MRPGSKLEEEEPLAMAGRKVELEPDFAGDASLVRAREGLELELELDSVSGTSPLEEEEEEVWRSDVEDESILASVASSLFFCQRPFWFSVLCCCSDFVFCPCSRDFSLSPHEISNKRCR